MAILVHKCPHCQTDSISLAIVAGTAGDTETWWSAHLKCPKCSLPSAAQLVAVAPSGKRHRMDQALSHVGDPTDNGWEILAFWPDPPEPTIPTHLPPDIARIYLQAERNFSIKGNEEAAGMMYRKALDVGLKIIDPSLKGMLKANIKSLAAAGKLTADIAEWSDHVRDLGNDAAHDADPINRDELSDLRNFSEMVLRYLFSLPGAVKKRRGEKLDWEGDCEATA